MKNSPQARPRALGRIRLLAAVVVLIAAGPAIAQTVPLAGNHPAEVEKWRPVGWADPDQTLVMRIRFATRNRQALEKLLAEQQDPKSPNYHHWLQAGEFADRFGPRPSDINVVSEWLKLKGFQILSTNQAGRYAEFSGPEWMVERELHTSIATFADGHAYANLTDPLIPSEFAGLIDSIQGLDNLQHSMPLLHRHDPLPAAPTGAPELPAMVLAESFDQAQAQDSPSLPGAIPVPETIVANARAFGPSDLRTFYDENPLLTNGITGTSDCIAIVGASDFLTAAVTDFDTQFGLPASNITRVLSDGSNPGINGDETEALLDLEWSHAVAPSAAQRYYISAGVTDAIAGAISDNACSAINISFGFCGGGSAFYQSMDSMFAQAAAQGQSVFISSGDQGAAGIVLNSAGTECVSGTSRNVSELAASPNVTGVGGTEFSPIYNSGGSDSGSVAESAWGEASFAGGGGVSQVFAKPSFQTGTGVPADGQRDVPDVAMVASPDLPGVFLGNDSGGTAVIDCCWGGTSLGAPIWTGIAKLLEQQNLGRVGNLDPRLYSLANSKSCGGGIPRRNHRQQHLQRCAGLHGRSWLRPDHRMGHGRYRELRPGVRRGRAGVADSNTDAFTHADSNALADADQHADPDAYSVTNPDPFADPFSRSDANANAYSVTDALADYQSIAESYADPFTRSDANPDSNSVTVTNADAFADCQPIAESYADSVTGSDANPNAYSLTDVLADCQPIA